MKVFKIFNIKYETDGENDTDLPKTLVVKIPDDITNEYEINEYISNEISNVTGFLHKGYNTEPELNY